MRPQLTVINGFGQRSKTSGPVVSRAKTGDTVDLGAAISALCDPNSGNVRTTWAAGIALTGVVLEYSESPLVPENLPLPSVDMAVELLNWMNDHTEKEGGYHKTVIRCEWADGSVWRQRFDVNGKWHTNDLFGRETGGGITWDNSTDKGKFYDRAAKLGDQTFSDLILSIQKWRRAEDERRDAEYRVEKAKVSAALSEVGIQAGVVYHQAAHTDCTDYFHGESYWAVVDMGAWYECHSMRSGSDISRSYLSADSYWLRDTEQRTHSTPTEYATLEAVPSRIRVRDLAERISGEQYPGAAVQNRIIKSALQASLPRGAKVSVRGNAGTAYGWSDITIEGASSAEIKAALDVVGATHQGGNERYHMSIPADVADSVLARLQK